MLPGFRQLPESATKDWHGPEDEEPRYVKGMRAAARAHSAKSALQGVRAALRGYVVGVTATATFAVTMLPGLLGSSSSTWGWLTSAIGLAVFCIATQKVVGAFLTLRKEEGIASTEADKINAEIERNIRVLPLPETEEDRVTPAAASPTPTGLPGEKAA